MARRRRMSSGDDSLKVSLESSATTRRESRTFSRNTRPKDPPHVSAQEEYSNAPAPRSYDVYLPQPLQQIQNSPSQLMRNHGFSDADIHNSCYDHQGHPRQLMSQTFPSSNAYQFHAYASNPLLPPSSTAFDYYHTNQSNTLPSLNHQFHMLGCMNSQPDNGIDVGIQNDHYLLPQRHESSFPPTQVNYTESTSTLDDDTTSNMNESPPLTQIAAPSQTSEEVLEIGRRAYDMRLRAAFDDIIRGRLNEASDKLRVSTKWLLTSVEGLKLHVDSETDYPHKLSLWREFNHCWEALALRQKDLMERERYNDWRTTNTLSKDTITTLLHEIVSLNDQIDRFGLVDKELGVWEDQIEFAFGLCLDQITNMEKSQDPILRPPNPT